MRTIVHDYETELKLFLISFAIHAFFLIKNTRQLGILAVVEAGFYVAARFHGRLKFPFYKSLSTSPFVKRYRGIRPLQR